MKKEQFKKAVRREAVHILRRAANDLEEEIRRYRETDERTLDEGQSDISQQAQDDANQEIINELSRQINFIREKINRLELLDETIESRLEAVKPGAVVLTDQANFFTGVGIKEFEINGTEIAGLDIGTDLYLAMEGKRAGDRLSFRGRSYLIEEVF